MKSINTKSKIDKNRGINVQQKSKYKVPLK